MALTIEAEQAVIERWTGPIHGDDETAVQARIDRIGSAEGAALEILMRARSEMAMSAAITRSADDASNHRHNVGWLTDLIKELVAYIMDSDIPVTPALEDLIDQALGKTLEATTGIDIVAGNRRRG